MSSPTTQPRTSGSRLRFALAAIPWIGMLVVTPFVNRVEPFVLGMPFLLFWIVLCVVITSICMAIIYKTDPRNAPENDAPGAESAAVR